MRSYFLLFAALAAAAVSLGCELADMPNGFDTAVPPPDARYEDTALFYNKQAYYGKERGGTIPIPPSSLADSIFITQPTVKKFRADGFFTLKGVINNPARYNYAWVQVTKDGTDLKSSYFPQKNFEQRIWLPFGKGTYTVSVWNLTEIHISLHGEGTISGYRGHSTKYTFSVENTRDEDGRFLYPSYAIQSDNADIARKAAQLTAGKVHDEEKIQAIHTGVCKLLRYDYASLQPNAYKKQDAVSALRSGLAVCEGYTSLTAALLRASGIRAKAVIGSGHPQGASRPELHAWLHVKSKKNGAEEKYRLLDPTWNDSGDGNPQTTYYLLDLEANEYNNNTTHKQGRDELGNPLGGEDGKYKGTRPGRNVMD